MDEQYLIEVEELLGGMGTIIFPDGTEQFADLNAPDIVFSPRLPPQELNAFCAQHIERYREYANQYQSEIAACVQPLPPFPVFW